MFYQMAIGFVILSLVFIPLERKFSLRREQPILRKGWLTDVIHFFLSRLLTTAGSYAIAVILYIFFHQLLNNPLQAAITRQPGWLQFVEAYLIAEITFYGIHRLAHTWHWLWKFHAVHHSSENLDWLASVRLHPTDMIIANIVVGLPLILLGFSAETFGVWSVISTFLAVFNHANVRVSYGPLRWILADPHFHHWHHANEPQAINKNFSGLPLLDKLFGTAYMPKNQWPRRYGVDDAIPQNYFKQLLFPFRKTRPAIANSDYAPYPPQNYSR